MSNTPRTGCVTLLAVAVVAFLAGRCSVEPPSAPVEASSPSRFAGPPADGSTESAAPLAVEAEAAAAPNPSPDTAVEDDRGDGAGQPGESADVAASASAGGDGYTDVDGHAVSSPAFAPSAPPGASARCRDGSFSFSHHRRGTCSRHGGVADWL